MGNDIDRDLIRRKFRIYDLGDCDTYNMERSFIKLVNALKIDVTDTKKFEAFWSTISPYKAAFHSKSDKSIIYTIAISTFLIMYFAEE